MPKPVARALRVDGCTYSVHGIGGGGLWAGAWGVTGGGERRGWANFLCAGGWAGVEAAVEDVKGGVGNREKGGGEEGAEQIPTFTLRSPPRVPHDASCRGDDHVTHVGSADPPRSSMMSS